MESKPSIEQLGRDLLDLSAPRIAFSIALPFALSIGYFVLASEFSILAAIPFLVALDFFTYGSVSHDLVHRNYRLPKRLNHALLSLIELLCLRSGHAYLKAHIHHHKRFPKDDDIEGHAAKLGLVRALLHGILFQHRIFWWALTVNSKHRRWILVEGLVLYSLFAAAIALFPTYPIFSAYAAIIHIGGWIIPFMTSYIPHDAQGETELTQTRLFRGKALSFLALDHLYHLEHHMYPNVPHQNWPKLAKRLDSFFQERDIRPKKLLF